MKVEFDEHFKENVEGTDYSLPLYRIDDNGLIRLGNDPSDEETYHNVKYVRGSKDPEDKIGKVTGIRHENLLAMMIHDLKIKHKEVPCKESACAITKLEEALFWMRQRQIDRTNRGVIGTYKK